MWGEVSGRGMGRGLDFCYRIYRMDGWIDLGWGLGFRIRIRDQTLGVSVSLGRVRISSVSMGWD